MEKKKQKMMDDTGKIKLSRNKNKNRNKTLQNKVREKEMVKKVKLMEKELSKKPVIEVSQDTVEDSALIMNSTVRDGVIVVPERSQVIVEDGDDGIVDEDNFVKVKVDRFRFVDSAQEERFDKFKFFNENDENVEEKQELEEFNTYDSNASLLEEKESVSSEIVDQAIETIEVPEVKSRKYYSFEARIMVLLTIIVVAFFIAGLFIFNAISEVSSSGILYTEKSTIDYSVCLNEGQYNGYYKDTCLNEDMEYLTDIVDNVLVNFGYEVEYSEDVSTELSYYVVSKVNIYKGQHGRILNSTEEVLVERTNVEVLYNNTSFSVEFDVPFARYNQYVKDYNKEYSLESYATIDATLYVDNGNIIKKVSTISMPISEKTFSIDEDVINNEKQKLTIVDGEWKTVNTTYAAVGVVFVLIGLIGIIRLSNLILKATGNSSLYNRKLKKILKEYDKFIVISRGDYTITEGKKVIKVTSFSELLDARNAVEKPIVYVRVNNVKSEFYVEDLEIVYKYTMKEVDVEGK